MVGWNWQPHTYMLLGLFLADISVGLVRSWLMSGVYSCAGCDGFEARVRRAYEKSKTIVKVKDERITVFGTIWYQANHAALPVQGGFLMPSLQQLSAVYEELANSKRVRVNVGRRSRHSVIFWWGNCSYSKLKVTYEVRKMLCPKCGHELLDGQYF